MKAKKIFKGVENIPKGPKRIKIETENMHFGTANVKNNTPQYPLNLFLLRQTRKTNI